MTESEPDRPGRGAQAGADPLAARLLAARRALTARDIDPDVRTRLHLRFMAICTSLKAPAANPARGAQRLDRLIADAEIARRGTCAASARPASLADPGEGAGRQPRGR
ncbi:MAG: hypothetical protein ACR2FU_13105 [Streptosporangiaceae bacterium]